MATDWATPILAFVGGGVGAALTYAAAVRGDRQRESASRREEWGRRFTAALGDLGDDDPRRRRLGQGLLERLASSSLASTEERHLAQEMLAEAAGYTPDGADLQSLVGTDLGASTFLADDEGEPSTAARDDPTRGGGRNDGSKRVIRVGQGQIAAARAVIRMSGGPDKVTPLIRKIAEAGVVPPTNV